MTRAIHPERVALALLHALYSSDKEAAKLYGISTRTIEKYRRHLGIDEELTAIFLLKKEIFERDWVGRTAPAIIEAIDFLQRAAQSADPKDPDAIHAMAGALKILSEISMIKQIIDARMDQYRRERQQSGEVRRLS